LHVRGKCYETSLFHLWGKHPISPPGVPG
jgi:hypothetical protein